MHFNQLNLLETNHLCCAAEFIALMIGTAVLMQNTRATPYKWDKTNSCMCVKLLKCRQKCILMRTRANALRVVYPFGSPLIPLNLPTKTGKFYTLNVCTIVHNFSIIYCLFYFKVVFRMKSEYFYCFILPLLFVDNFHMI